MRSAALVCVLLSLSVLTVSAIKSQSKTENGDVFLRVNIEADDSQENPFQIRVESQSDQPQQGGFFSPFRRFGAFRSHPRSLFLNDDSLLESKPAPLPSFSNIFRHLFNDREEQPAESPVEMFSFQIEPMFDEEPTHRSPFDALPPFSRIFQHMSNMLHQLQASSGMHQQMQRPNKPLRRGGCTLLEVCGEDIDNHCAYAKRLAIAHALPGCLARHSTELSERCSAYMTRRYGVDGLPIVQDEEAQHDHVAQAEEHDDDDDDDADDAEIIASTPQTQTPSEPVVEVIPAVPLTPVAPTVPLTPREVCKATAQKLCPNADLKNVVHVMACLNRNREQVPAECLDTIKETTAFNCAPDAEKFCDGMTDRADIARCLHPHAKQLAAECVAAAKKSASTGKLRATTRFGTEAETVEVSPEPSSHSNVLLAVGLSGLVTLVVVGVVVAVVRRRRSRPQVRYQNLATVQLVNPNHERSAVSAPADKIAVTADEVSYEPRPEEQL